MLTQRPSISLTGKSVPNISRSGPNAASSSGGTCNTVFVASSSVPNAIRNQLIHLELAITRNSGARSIPVRNAWMQGGDGRVLRVET